MITLHEVLRRQCGYTVTGLARETGFSHAYISQIEGNTTRPSDRYRKAAAAVLGVREVILFPDRDDDAAAHTR